MADIGVAAMHHDLHAVAAAALVAMADEAHVAGRVVGLGKIIAGHFGILNLACSCVAARALVERVATERAAPDLILDPSRALLPKTRPSSSTGKDGDRRTGPRPRAGGFGGGGASSSRRARIDRRPTASSDHAGRQGRRRAWSLVSKVSLPSSPAAPRVSASPSPPHWQRRGRASSSTADRSRRWMRSSAELR